MSKATGKAATPRSVIDSARNPGGGMVEVKLVDTFGAGQHFSRPVAELTEEPFSESPKATRIAPRLRLHSCKLHLYFKKCRIGTLPFADSFCEAPVFGEKAEKVPILRPELAW